MRAVAAIVLLLAAAARSASSSEAKLGEVTILYTNDLHSAFDPIPVYWLPGSPKLGGAADLAGLVNEIAVAEDGAFMSPFLIAPTPRRDPALSRFRSRPAV